MLKESRVKEMESQIKANDKTLDKLIQDYDTMRQLVSDKREKIKNLEIETDTTNKELRSAEMESQTLSKQINQIKKENTDIDNQLKEDAFKKKVEGIFKSSTDFYTCVIDRLKRKQEEYSESMSDYFNFIDPATVVEGIKRQIEAMSFAQDTIYMRGVKGEYDETTRELATQKAKNIRPSIAEARQRIKRIDAFIEHDFIIHRWYKESK